ncbi:hypothetical protein EF834_14960 [Rhodococcus spongiicola]|uniref:Uncharacterized protein n=1 Tax=Rhodococcus spongiicola TaxID=2487352 RepID=A0A3S3DZC1_9NOCA|nr:hypothetical protein EF834_14960 [Rhodococcus spongiicola]
MTKPRFLIVNFTCMTLVILGVNLSFLVQGNASGILGWSLALVALIVWFSAAVARSRKQNSPD